MIIDQLPLLDGDVQGTDEVPVERGTTTYKTTKAALVKSAADAAAAAQSTADEANAKGLPTGGTAGQVLVKRSASNYDAEWVDQSGGINRNLLDNWYFVGGGSQLGYGIFPINQQGQTSYVGTGNSIDRWYNYQTAVTMNVANDGLNITRQSEDFYSVCQKVSGVESLRGKTVTASLFATGYNRVRLMADGVNIADSGDTLVNDELRSITTAIPTNATELLFIIYTASTATTVAKAAKLEIGSTQTLAHQESGVWVLNEIPDYDEQLINCNMADGTHTPFWFSHYTSGSMKSINKSGIYYCYNAVTDKPTSVGGTLILAAANSTTMNGIYVPNSNIGELYKVRVVNGEWAYYLNNIN